MTNPPLRHITILSSRQVSMAGGGQLQAQHIGFKENFPPWLKVRIKILIFKIGAFFEFRSDLVGLTKSSLEQSNLHVDWM